MGGPAFKSGVQVHDVIRSFQLGDDPSTIVDLEDEKFTMTQEEWFDKLESFKNESTKGKPLKITFLQGLKIRAEYKASPSKRRRRLFALSERFRRVREFQASTHM